MLVPAVMRRRPMQPMPTVIPSMPTVACLNARALEQAVTDLEGADAVLAVSSGMAAVELGRAALEGVEVAGRVGSGRHRSGSVDRARRRGR
jgi:hypothetical protein